MEQTTKQSEHENCEHSFWVEDLEGYRCACREKIRKNCIKLAPHKNLVDSGV